MITSVSVDVFSFVFLPIVPPAIKGGNITTEVSTLLNSAIKLECETRGIPGPTITWYKDGHPIISNPEALYLERGQFLQISRVQISDSAKYTCQATNIAGTAEKTFQVDVYGKKRLDIIDFGWDSLVIFLNLLPLLFVLLGNR